MIPINLKQEYSSYKDADGFVFYENDKVYRKINSCFLQHYQTLKSKRIYDVLIEQKLLINFREEKRGEELYLETERIPIITYPYEWSFEQLKQAALLQLKLMEVCLLHDAILKDASPFNVQFRNNKACFIDLLSIEPYEEGKPWLAYKQFCEFFLSPLLLSSYHSGNWNKLLMIYPEGIPLKHTASLLPFKARFNSLSLFHIITHSKFSKGGNKSSQKKISKTKITSIINHLKIGIEELKSFEKESNWSDYQNNLPYSKEELQTKKKSVQQLMADKQYTTILDVGANHDLFAEAFISSAQNIVAIDTDDLVVDHLFKKSISKPGNFIPLNVDITMVSPDLGINLKERKSFFERVQPDLTIALAVIHHLFHTRNIPLNYLAEIFNTCSRDLMIEFVSESDEQFIKIQNNNNKHIYNKAAFEKAFAEYFIINSIIEIKITKRYLYFMSSKKQEF